jgi:hypothetical protein
MLYTTTLSADSQRKLDTSPSATVREDVRIQEKILICEWNLGFELVRDPSELLVTQLVTVPRLHTVDYTLYYSTV